MSEQWRPAEVIDRYRSLLAAVGSVADELDGVTLTSHWPLVGTAPRRVLVIGQAVFGWIPSWRAAQLSTSAGMDEVLAETRLPATSVRTRWIGSSRTASGARRSGAPCA